MANTKDLFVKATIVVNDDGEIIVSVHKENNFADTLTLNVDDTSGSGVQTDVASNLRVYATGVETEPSLSFNPGLVLAENWFFNLVFESTDQKERLEFDFTAFQSDSQRVGFVVEPALKVTKVL